MSSESESDGIETDSSDEDEDEDVDAGSNTHVSSSSPSLPVKRRSHSILSLGSRRKRGPSGHGLSTALPLVMERVLLGAPMPPPVLVSRMNARAPLLDAELESLQRAREDRIRREREARFGSTSNLHNQRQLNLLIESAAWGQRNPDVTDPRDLKLDAQRRRKPAGPAGTHGLAAAQSAGGASDSASGGMRIQVPPGGPGTGAIAASGAGEAGQLPVGSPISTEDIVTPAASASKGWVGRAKGDAGPAAQPSASGSETAGGSGGGSNAEELGEEELNDPMARAR